MNGLGNSHFYPNGLSKHHFLLDGNLMIKARRGLFFVHESIVCPYSRKLANLVNSAPNNGTIKIIVLEYNHRRFNMLLHAIYGGLRFRLSSIKDSLKLYTIAREWEASDIEEFCSIYLLDHVPTSLAQLDAVEQYRQEFRLVTTILWICKNRNFALPLPWALYMFNIHNLHPQGPNVPARAQLENTNPLNQVYAQQLQDLRLAIISSNKAWNIGLLEFYAGLCNAEVWDDIDCCFRRSNPGVGQEFNMLMDTDDMDPFPRMSKALSACEEEQLCQVCIRSLRAVMKGYMEDLYMCMRGAVGLTELEPI
ncbi:hypothetical protein FRC08_007777 [Ceratobasidium sp. 394]|nr:hypothetical protein FRC08_007777 [Ceratobasidium sp. 394]